VPIENEYMTRIGLSIEPRMFHMMGKHHQVMAWSPHTCSVEPGKGPLR
jgi:hypothetical protein